MRHILKVLVGSRAHGLASPTSDYDYRGVFVNPTSGMLSIIGPKMPESEWLEHDKMVAGNEQDDTTWEIAHFLKLAIHCNPSILEAFTAPVVDEGTTETGLALRALFPKIWDPKRVSDAFIGYGLNQRKKFLESKDGRPWKYAVAYLRTLIQADRLLTHGVLMTDMSGHPEYQTLMLFRNGMASPGDVINKCMQWQGYVEAAAKLCHHVPDHAAVNDFLLKVRQENWT